MQNNDRIQDLKQFSIQIRIETVKELAEFGAGHVGGAMSMIEALAVLYGGAMNIDPANPKWEERDRLVCSKGHSGPSLYAALALKGYFPMKHLTTLNQPGTMLPSHCDMNRTPGIDMTTGSLGQGMSSGIGIAVGNKLYGRKCRTYIIIGDGECQEGQVWEGVLFAANKKLDNVTLLIDNNKFQLDGPTSDINNLESFEDKFESFGWSVQRVDGHNVEEIDRAVENAKRVIGKPSVIILDTVKGYGCTFTNGRLCHHLQISKKEAEEALEVLYGQMAELNNKYTG